jgi:alpha-L-fucosidase
MDVNAVSIRGTQRTPLDRQAWGDSTVGSGAKENTIYLHVMHWPEKGHLVVGGLEGDVKRAYLLADGGQKALATRRVNAMDLAVTLPATAPDAVDTVVVLEMAAKVKGVTGRLLSDVQLNNQLLGFDAAAEGGHFAYGDGKTNRDYVDGLETTGTSLSWMVRTDRATDYRVTLHTSSVNAAEKPGTTFTLRLGEKTLTAAAPVTTTAHDVASVDMGTLHVAPGEAQKLVLTQGGEQQAMHFFEVDLEPVGQ